MASNEDYLDELLKSMSSDSASDSALNRLHSTPEEKSVEVQDMGMGKMDQAMIDALLAGVSADLEPVEESIQLEEAVQVEEENPTSALAQLMAEMEEEVGDSSNDGFDDDFMSEAGIEALLSAAQNTEDDLYNDQVLSFDVNSDSDMAEIEALLDLADSNEPIDDNSQLLKLLGEGEEDLFKNLEADGLDSEPKFIDLENEFSFDNIEAELDLEQLEGDFDLAQFDAELDLEQLEAELDNAFGESFSNDDGEEIEDKKKSKENKKKDKEKKAKERKNKEEKEHKGIFSKIFSLLMEEIPEEEEPSEKGKYVSDENKKILDELDQEEDKKIKVKEKKVKKEKKEKKAKPKKEKKVKKDKPKKEKKPKKVKVEESFVPEKKVPRKKVVVSFVFAFSVLALILLIEFLVPSMITLGTAREAFNKGNYYEAYKEYYVQKLSEEDEKKFQAATVIMRMQSNLEGYYNYLKLNDEIMAIHSLLEGVHIKFDVLKKAEELGVLSQVSTVYDKILEILNGNYHVTEEEALELIEEKSDAVYTRKLEAIAESGEYTESHSEQTNWDDMLPEEENLFEENTNE